jgi:hypothetical protein
MRSLLTLVLLVLGPICHGNVPALQLGRALPNGCMVHAILYVAGLDPAIGKAEVVKVAGGGGIPHAIAVVSAADGRRYGRDEDLGVFALDDLSPQEAYDRARQRALARGRISGGSNEIGASEERRSLRDAHDRLAAAGFEPQRVANVLVWQTGGTAYVYSPLRGSAEVRTCSRNLARIAAAALKYWAGRRQGTTHPGRSLR